MPSSHLILCRPLLLLPAIPPSIRVFSNESTLRIRWPKYWSFTFSIIPSNEHPGLIAFRMDWLLIFLLAILIPACASSSPAFHMMYSAYKLNKQGDNIPPWHTAFPIWNQSIVPYPVLSVASWPSYRFLTRKIRWSGIPISRRIFHSLLWSTQSNALAQSMKQKFFWNFLAFSMIQWILAIWSLVPLPFLNQAWTSESSQFMYCWSLTWRIIWDWNANIECQEIPGVIGKIGFEVQNEARKG